MALNVYGAHKAAWHIQRISDLRKGRDIVPTHIHFVISDLCNQDCHFCSYRMSNGFSAEQFADEHGNRNPARFIETAKAKEILNDCARMGVRAIEFTGGGEPTAHKAHIEIIGHAQKLGLKTGLVTNGVLLKDDPVFRALDWIRISLDAGKAITYEDTRKSKAWPKVMANLKLAGTFEKPRFGVGYVVTRENWQQIEEASRIARDAGASYIRLSAMFSYDGANYYSGLRTMIDSARRISRRMETDKFKIIDLFGDRVQDLDQGKPDYQFCGEQQFVLYIGGNLKVYRCCTNAYTAHGEIGDLRDQTFEEWMKSHRRFDFDARSCHHCQFNTKNRQINFLLDPSPEHVDFV